MDRPAVAASLVAAAGAHQLGALKDLCLRACRSPVAFFVRYGGALTTAAGAARVGLRHAAACFGCCVGLMVALTGAGAVDLAWMVALAAVMLIEKVHPGVASSAGSPAFSCSPSRHWCGRIPPPPWVEPSGLLAVATVLVAADVASRRRTTRRA